MTTPANENDPRVKRTRQSLLLGEAACVSTVITRRVMGWQAPGASVKKRLAAWVSRGALS